MAAHQYNGSPATDLGQLSDLTLPAIDQSSFSHYSAQLDRKTLQQVLANEETLLAYGDSASPLLLSGLREAVDQCSASFYTMLEVSPQNVVEVVEGWLAGYPLGKISPELAQEFIEDIRRDVQTFITATRSPSITLRMVLELGSGCEAFSSLADHAPAPEWQSLIESIISRLEYEASFLFHCDEDLVNQTKTYVGAPTLALNHSQVATDPSFNRWFDLFRGQNPPLAVQIENLLASGSMLALKQLEIQLEQDMARFQLELPELARPETRPWQFLPGRAHLYFGAQDKIEGIREYQTPKALLHAKPAVWGAEPGARRFSMLMDTPSDIQLADLLD